MPALFEALATLATMSSAQLEEAWRESFGEIAPVLPASLLRRAISHHLQERAIGALSPATVQMLHELSNDLTKGSEKRYIKIKPGTRLLRRWKKRQYAVIVTENGIEFEGQLFSSLSQVAQVITGARWSGPRFFGLTAISPPPSRKGAARG